MALLPHFWRWYIRSLTSESSAATYRQFLGGWDLRYCSFACSQHHTASNCTFQRRICAKGSRVTPPTSPCIDEHKQHDFTCRFRTVLVKFGGGKRASSINCANNAKRLCDAPPELVQHLAANVSGRPVTSFQSTFLCPRRLLAFHYPRCESGYHGRDTVGIKEWLWVSMKPLNNSWWPSFLG